MIAVSNLSSKMGDYQRPYLTVFRVERTPDDSYLPSIVSGEMDELNKTIREMEFYVNAFTARIAYTKPLVEAYDAKRLQGLHPESQMSAEEVEEVSLPVLD